MEVIREQLKKPLTIGIISLVVGLFIGLVVIGWWLWPVKWVDATPKELNQDSKVAYMRMAIEAFGNTHLVDEAKQNYDALGTDAAQVLQAVSSNPVGLNPQDVTAFSLAVGAPAPAEAGAQTTLTAPGTEVVPPGEAGVTPVTTETPAKSANPLGFLAKLALILCLLVIVAAVVILGVFYLSKHGGLSFLKRQPGAAAPVAPPGVSSAPSAPVSPASAVQTPTARATPWSTPAPAPVPAAANQPPMVQYMASYKYGEDLFDESFSVDSQSGEFLGECGVGISETIGVGDPKKVTAFEVWLFDKNDIQTVTKVMMSAHAFSDDATRQRLEAKGEPLAVDAGGQVILETQSLRMVARVVDMSYGESALPPQSFFDRFVLELAVWQKP